MLNGSAATVQSTTFSLPKARAVGGDAPLDPCSPQKGEKIEEALLDVRLAAGKFDVDNAR